MKSKIALQLAAAGLGLGLIARPADAAMLTTTSVLYSGSQLVMGSNAQTTVLKVPSAGELFLTLSDLDFPSLFGSLKFDLTDSVTAKVGLADAGTLLSLDLSGPATLYANVFAKAQGPLDIGLYNLTATFLSTTPVPLPATGALLASVTALAGLLELMWRRSFRRAQATGCAQATVTTAVA